MVNVDTSGIAPFLYREARLIDEGRLAEWADLFTDDARYWLPIGAGRNPAAEAAIICDDLPRLKMRVHQIERYRRHAQDPRSRLVHALSNLEIEPAAGAAEETIARCVVTIHELRPGDFQGLHAGLGHQRTIAGRCEYRLRWSGTWRIVEKKLLLLDRDQPLYNLTFIL